MIVATLTVTLLSCFRGTCPIQDNKTGIRGDEGAPSSVSLNLCVQPIHLIISTKLTKLQRGY